MASPTEEGRLDKTYNCSLIPIREWMSPYYSFLTSGAIIITQLPDQVQAVLCLRSTRKEILGDGQVGLPRRESKRMSLGLNSGLPLRVSSTPHALPTQPRKTLNQMSTIILAFSQARTEASTFLHHVRHRARLSSSTE